MKKEYQSPIVEIIVIDQSDIVTNSAFGGEKDSFQLPEVEV